MPTNPIEDLFSYLDENKHAQINQVLFHLSKLIEKRTPALSLHPDERYFPIAFSDYVSLCSLVVVRENGIEDILIQKGQLKTTYLEKRTENELRKIHHLKKGEKLSLRVAPMTANEKKIYYGDKNKSVVHCIANMGRLKDGKEEYDVLRLTYAFIYSENPAPYVFGLVGQHPGDVEHLSVYIRLDENGVPVNDEGELQDEVVAVCYSAHGDAETTWRKGADIQFKDTHPKAFIAKDSHATYGESGNFMRIAILLEHVADSECIIPIVIPMPAVIYRDEDLSMPEGDVNLGKAWATKKEAKYNATRWSRQVPLTLFAPKTALKRVTYSDNKKLIPIWPFVKKDGCLTAIATATLSTIDTSTSTLLASTASSVTLFKQALADAEENPPLLANTHSP